MANPAPGQHPNREVCCQCECVQSNNTTYTWQDKGAAASRRAASSALSPTARAASAGATAVQSNYIPQCDKYTAWVVLQITERGVCSQAEGWAPGGLLLYTLVRTPRSAMTTYHYYPSTWIRRESLEHYIFAQRSGYQRWRCTSAHKRCGLGHQDSNSGRAPVIKNTSLRIRACVGGCSVCGMPPARPGTGDLRSLPASQRAQLRAHSHTRKEKTFGCLLPKSTPGDLSWSPRCSRRLRHEYNAVCLNWISVQGTQVRKQTSTITAQGSACLSRGCLYTVQYSVAWQRDTRCVMAPVRNSGRRRVAVSASLSARACPQTHTKQGEQTQIDLVSSLPRVVAGNAYWCANCWPCPSTQLQPRVPLQLVS